MIKNDNRPLYNSTPHTFPMYRIIRQPVKYALHQKFNSTANTKTNQKKTEGKKKRKENKLFKIFHPGRVRIRARCA